ncbi:GOLPH3/VPS74 family protein [Streptomyces ziwulingensis]|uniref:GPP34 family phosphoprotein n=1 Tax=Streptomyces ziwulingensis TaxID=1045501 RepID=A0ABP9CPS9_9ACTN
MRHGSLPLPSRLYLLARDAGRPAVTDAVPPQRLVRAGALAELARRGLLVDDDGTVTPLDLDSRTGDAVLDGLLDLVRESLPHGWRTWVRLRARITADAVREQLVAEGWMRAEKRRVLGVFPSVDHVLARPALVRALREETRGALCGPVPVAEVPTRDAAVAALAGAARLRGLTTGCERPRDAERIEALAGRGGTAPGAGRIMRALCAAVTAHATGTVAAAAG